MIFPQLLILEQTNIEDKFGNQEPYYRVSLDWVSFDKEITNDLIKWYKDYYISSPRNKNQKIRDLLVIDEKLLDQILKHQLNWEEHIKPTEFESFYQKSNNFLLKKSYWLEINNYKKLAQEERKKQFGFDTNVRERCLELSEKAVEIYFYLISDAIYISDGFDYYDSVLFNALCLFRFWRHQSGVGVDMKKVKRLEMLEVADKSKNINLIQKLENHLTFTPIPGYRTPPINSTSGDDYYHVVELLYNQIILNYIRDEKISSILAK